MKEIEYEKSGQLMTERLDDETWEKFKATRYFLPHSELLKRANEKKILRRTRSSKILFAEKLSKDTLLAMGFVFSIGTPLTAIFPPLGGAIIIGGLFVSSLYGLVGAIGEYLSNKAMNKMTLNEIDDLVNKTRLHDDIYSGVFFNFLYSLTEKSPEQYSAALFNLDIDEKNPLLKILKNDKYSLAKQENDTKETRTDRVKRFQEQLANSYLEEEYKIYLNKPKPPLFYNSGLKYSYIALAGLSAVFGIATLVTGLIIGTAGVGLVVAGIIGLGLLAVSAIAAVLITKRKFNIERQDEDRKNAVQYLNRQNSFGKDIKSCKSTLATKIEVVEAQEENMALRKELKQQEKLQTTPSNEHHPIAEDSSSQFFHHSPKPEVKPSSPKDEDEDSENKKPHPNK